MDTKKPVHLGKLSKETRREEQDKLHDDIYSKENEQRRKRGLPPVSNNLSEKQKRAAAQKKRLALKKTMRLYFEKYNKGKKDE